MNDLSLQELLQILERDPEKGPDLVPSKNDSKLSTFYSEKKIRSGVDRIATFMVYYLYKEVWGGDMSKIGFFRVFNKDFIQVRTGKQRYYLLDGDSFDLSREGKLEAQFKCKGKK